MAGNRSRSNRAQGSSQSRSSSNREGGRSQGSSSSNRQGGSQGGSQSRSGMSRSEAGRKGGEAPHVCRGLECADQQTRERVAQRGGQASRGGRR